MYQHLPRPILLDPLHRIIEPDPISQNAIRSKKNMTPTQLSPADFSPPLNEI